MEHFAFVSSQREDRQEYQNDDENPENHRLPDFLHRLHDQSRPVPCLPMMLGHETIDVFHHHHGPVHHHADRDDQTTERHQIGRQPHVIHNDERGQRRYDQRCRHHQCASHITQK